MCYLLHELAVAGHTGVIIYMPDFVEDLKSMITDGQKLKETTDILKSCDLLIFDDIGAENLNPWVRDHVMGSILNYRMNRKPTFYVQLQSGWAGEASQLYEQGWRGNEQRAASDGPHSSVCRCGVRSGRESAW